MNLAIRSAVAAALLGAVSMSAYAVNVTPPATGPAPNPGLGDGGLMAEVFDSLTNHYLTVWLGGDFGTFKASATPSGGVTIDYGVMTGFGTLFSASDVSSGNVQFLVAAGNAFTAGHNEVITTLSAPQATVANGAVQNAATALTTAIGGFNGVGGCNSVNFCSATSTVDPGFLPTISPMLVGNSPTTGIAGGSAVTMYDIVQVKAGLGNGTITALHNANGNGTWSLSASGDLTYTIAGAASAVPLPAAIWLLGSGLLGLAGVSRRKKAALVTA